MTYKKPKKVEGYLVVFPDEIIEEGLENVKRDFPGWKMVNGEFLPPWKLELLSPNNKP